jgi:hypothetical protein
MPESVVSRVNTMTTREDQKSTIDFTDRHGQPLEDPDKPEDNMDQHDSDNDDDTTPDIIAGVDASNTPPGIYLEIAETPGVDYEIPGVGEPMETAGVGKTAGVPEESPAESGQDSDSEPGLEGSVSDQYSGSYSDTGAVTIEPDTATSSNIADDDDDEPPPQGDGNESSDDEDDDNEPEAEPEIAERCAPPRSNDTINPKDPRVTPK